MPVINVQLLTGRTQAQKEAFMKEVATAAQRTLRVPGHAVTIILSEVSLDHWSVGQRTMTDIQAALPAKE
ncbi:tautomerase family protein [Bacillus sp. NP157]|nr:tautomerase family protein [Bacillus sp. NP157]